ncbi:hypothetical protein [Pseudomonas sp. Au-Pse12]|uniref:hypothetical protein n=1 Tax=Pseudomonas sp. Au-Pse12 TaxID=2906459 RepID=UPI001E5FB060|nr:hypothetical protein [Pseudomonas sp. Au-Pse12]MCE4058477.1 hypothetical protein [Pseudomonas sp. Au-Pse12]
MSTEQSQQLGAPLTVVLDPVAMHLVQRFRDCYARYQACEDTAQMRELGKQVDDWAFKLACTVESSVEQAEKAAAKG